VSQTKAELIKGLNINASAPATALQIDASGNVNIDSNTLYVDATNNRVGLGTSSPTSLLTLAAASPAVDLTFASNANFKHTIEATGYASSPISSNSLAIKVANGSGTQATVMHLNGEGRVGIGTTSVGATLSVNGDAIIGPEAGTRLVVTPTENDKIEIKCVDSTSTARALAFTVGANEAMRLDASSRLLVGTSTAFGSNDELLHIASPSAGSIALLRNDTSIGSGNELGGIRWYSNATTSSTYQVCAQIRAVAEGTFADGDKPSRLEFSTTADGASSPTERMRIASTGRVTFEVNSTTGGFYINTWSSGVGNSTVKYNTSTGQLTFDSSSRLIKANIEDCPYGINAIKQLQPRIYKRKDCNQVEIGFVADEMREVVPELAPLGPKSALTGDSNDTEEIPISVNYDKFTAVLTAALQEAIAKIETLEAKVAALEAS
jgi:hypothetical protein